MKWCRRDSRRWVYRSVRRRSRGKQQTRSVVFVVKKYQVVVVKSSQFLSVTRLGYQGVSLGVQLVHEVVPA